MRDNEEYQHQLLDVLPLKLTAKDIHEYILPNTKYSDDSYIVERINKDVMPVRISADDNPRLAKYNDYLINSIELHQAKSKNQFSNNKPTYRHNIFRILEVKRSASYKSVNISNENLLLITNNMYANKAEIKAYKANDITLPTTKNTRNRTSNKKEEKQERIIAILINLLTKESVKAKSSRYTKGEGNINVLAVSGKIIELANEYGINKGLTSDASLSTELNAILKEYPQLKTL